MRVTAARSRLRVVPRHLLLGVVVVALALIDAALAG